MNRRGLFRSAGSIVLMAAMPAPLIAIGGRPEIEQGASVHIKGADR